MNLRAIQEIASAVQAGAEAAKRGETTNPFDGINEQLRIAFHFGWNTQQGTVALLTVEQLVARAKIHAAVEGHQALLNDLSSVNADPHAAIARLVDRDPNRTA